MHLKDRQHFFTARGSPPTKIVMIPLAAFSAPAGITKPVSAAA
jgi:hypothetical protein